VSGPSEGVEERGGGGGALWWAALQEGPGVGASTMLRLARVFGSAEAAANASVEELVGRGGVSERQASELRRAAESVQVLRRRIEGWRAQGIELLTMEEEAYPAGLRDLQSPPPLLYVRGRLERDDARAVAVVGTREPDRAGARCGRRIARELAARGFTIVSGLARGIDTAGHEGALEEGRTAAVLGCGLLRIYPPENARLAGRIARHGALVAEVPPDTQVERRVLLARDRIQAALSRAVIVVQAHRQCGSIVTAEHAVRCGRLLYGVPWSEPPFSEGWARLREMGARDLHAEASVDEVAAEVEGWQREAEQRELM